VNYSREYISAGTVGQPLHAQVPKAKQEKLFCADTLNIKRRPSSVAKTKHNRRQTNDENWLEKLSCKT